MKTLWNFSLKLKNDQAQIIEKNLEFNIYLRLLDLFDLLNIHYEEKCFPGQIIRRNQGILGNCFQWNYLNFKRIILQKLSKRDNHPESSQGLVKGMQIIGIRQMAVMAVKSFLSI